jgi:hypothetical protein
MSARARRFYRNARFARSAQPAGAQKRAAYASIVITVLCSRTIVIRLASWLVRPIGS